MIPLGSPHLCPVSLLLSLLLLASHISAQEPVPGKTQQIETLDPETLGIMPYVMEATAPAGKVVVISRELFIDKDISHFEEEICATANPVKEKVTIFEPDNFPFSPRQDTLKGREAWRRSKASQARVQYSGTEALVPLGMHYGSSIIGDGDIKFTFYDVKDKKKQASYHFKCVVEDYASVKARHPDLKPLPAAGEKGWVYCGDRIVGTH